MTLFLFSAFFVTLQTQPEPPTLEEVPVTHVFVPTGFDDNDVAQIVVAGEFNSPCYRIGPAAVSIDPKEMAIHLKIQAYKYSAECEILPIQFKQVIDLGVLGKGDYMVYQANEKKGLLRVGAAATPLRDDHLYAPTKHAEFSQDSKTHKGVLTLRSPMPNSCYHLQRQRIRVIHNSPNVVEVLPILTFEREEGEECSETRTMVTVSLDMPEDLQIGKHLIHIRTMNGESLNLVEDVR